jgi:hypothetical protein
MNILRTKLIKENKSLICENMKIGKTLLNQGKISKEDLNTLTERDPSKTKKYVGWMSKVWINEKPDLDELSSYIEEYHTLNERHRVKENDIYKIPSFKALKKIVDEINERGDNLSLKDLENDYEVVLDNEDLLICSPNTHEASRKLGLSQFAYRSCGSDSAWCTTYKSPDHFNSYYYSNMVTFYYIKVKSERLKEELKNNFTNWEPLMVVAAAIMKDGRKDLYDGADKRMSESDTDKYLNIIGIS